MLISEQTRNFVKAVDEFSGKKIQLRDELCVIVEYFAQANDAEKFEELIFKAKYLKGLMNVFTAASQNSEVSNTEQIREDFTHNFGLLRDILGSITATLEENLKREFQRKFLDLSPEAMMNTKTLISDLDWAKRYLNDVRRGKAAQA
ncbi:MAG: hypothetical protein HUU54_14415 [Ignavibacteriaceae bacterium]|nr:hypothetical protein [Ignavibacteriaceae bacterium]